jgi:hypothetical protein
VGEFNQTDVAISASTSNFVHELHTNIFNQTDDAISANTSNFVHAHYTNIFLLIGQSPCSILEKLGVLDDRIFIPIIIW